MLFIIPTSWAGRAEGVASVSTWVGSKAVLFSPRPGVLLVVDDIVFPSSSFLPVSLSPGESFFVDPSIKGGPVPDISLLFAVVTFSFSLSKNISSLTNPLALFSTRMFPLSGNCTFSSLRSSSGPLASLSHRFLG